MDSDIAPHARLSLNPPARCPRVILTLLAMVGFWMGLAHPAMGKPVSKGDLFEASLDAKRNHANPAQDVWLRAAFVSPSGRTHHVHGFWDGGSRWRIRFRPDELGTWHYVTECSDPRDNGLHERDGKFRCSVQSLRNDLFRHGAIRVVPEHSTFQHADGTPFFWLADNVWDGPRMASRKEWTAYANVRANQGFTVALWRAAPGTGFRGRSAFIGTNVIGVNAPFLRRLDEKVRVLNEAGLVSAIVPFWETGVPEQDLLPEDQMIVLLRQMVGRWDAHHVVWVLAFDADPDGHRAARWRRIGRRVFDQVDSSPVIIFAGPGHWALNEFADESWVDALAFQVGNDVSEEAAAWQTLGPPTQLWKLSPARPVLNLLTAEEAGLSVSGTRISTAHTVESIARSLCVAPPAGICYQARGVAAWDQSIDTNTLAVAGVELMEWEKHLSLSGAQRAAQIARLLQTVDFTRLQPAPSLIRHSPGQASPAAVLSTPRNDQVLALVPAGTTLSIPSGTLWPGLDGFWFSLDSGEPHPAEGNEVDGATQFIPPGTGNWLLALGFPTVD